MLSKISGEKFSNLYLKIFGSIFILIALIALARTLVFHRELEFFWLCYWVLLFTGLGMVLKKGNWILIQLNILLISDLIWTVDFISNLFLSKGIFGATDYFFETTYPWFSQVLSLQHLFLLPVALFGLYILKVDFDKYNHTWFWSWIETAFIFGLSYIFGNFFDTSQNVNCAFAPCMKYLGTNFYPYTLIILFACMVVFTDLILRNVKVFSKS